MNVVGKVSSFITQGVYSVATPFHPFGGAVDIIVVQQNDGTFRSTPWYVRFGKFQGVLKGAEKVVRIEVNGVEANFHMFLDNSGEAYFVREVDPDKDSENLEDGREDNSTDFSNSDGGSKENDFSGQDASEFNNDEVDEIEVRDERVTLGMDRLERVESDSGIFYELHDEQSSIEGSVEFSEYDSSGFNSLESVEHALESQDSNSEVVLVSVDGHVLTAPISASERNAENVELGTPQFHLGPGEGTENFNRVEDPWNADYLRELDASAHEVTTENICKGNSETRSSEQQLELSGGDGEHLCHVEETQDSADQDKELCTESSEYTTTRFKRREVFKSCVELLELELQSPTNNQENVGSSVEILEAANDLNEKSPLSPSINETEEGNVEISRDSNELSTHDTGDPGSVSSPELQVEAATNERNTSHMNHDGSDSMPVQSVSNNQELQKQLEAHPTAKRVHNDQESHTDECSKSESHADASIEDGKSDLLAKLEISLCGNLLHAGMGLNAAEDAFNANCVSLEEFKLSASSIVKNENLIVRLQGKYLPWCKAAHIVLGMAAYGLDLPVDVHDIIPVEQEVPGAKEDDSATTPTQSGGWRLWRPFRRVKTLEHNVSNSSNFVDSDSVSQGQRVSSPLARSVSSPVARAVSTPTARAAADSPRKKIIRTNVPTTDEIASLNLKEGQNMVNFVFSTRVLGSQKVEAHIYLWKWNTRIVISDVDGTITKSDVLGQFMPLVGKDWTHSGIARLFCAIKENGYQLLFLSARAIVQSYLTKSFLFNLKQDGKSLPSGPVVISPDGLFPSLFREVIRRAPHEFKIACLEDIKALFPPDYNPFYAGFGNRDTDELSYRKIGIPKGKIFIINPKGEVAINNRVDVKSYTSLHTLVNDMFPPTSLVEQEDYNSWNYWKMPLPDID
ncbi:phosphatidate phosphatase PAH1 [Sesamum indicum]|uniref:phosphatidate phosphatase n=1 Tax=Sesamum indicum TaxID=4182 RepID=A0A6I9T9Y2_SESIN|nr:phosphatidate phosphatase PAH1 [Sesamum indicum]